MDENGSNKSIITIGDKGISLPNTIETSNKYPHVREYNPELLKDILLDIANKPAISIESICKDNGTSDAALYTWMLFNEDIERAYFQCKRIRESGKVDRLDDVYTQLIEEMDGITENDKVALRKIDLKTRLHRVNSLNVQWSAGKLHNEYKDKSEVDVNIHDPIAARVTAWEMVQQAKETTYEEVKEDKDNVTDDSKQDT